MENQVKNIAAKKHLVLLVFAIMAFLVYLSSISSSFHFDDTHNIIYNQDVIINELSVASLKKAALTDAGGFRPVAYITFALNYFFSSADTTSYHFINIIIHILNAFLIYLIIILIFSGDPLDDEGRERLFMSAFFPALFWLLTPLNSQAVIYIVQRMTLLATLFFLSGFYCYLMSKKSGKAFYLALCAIAYVLSLLSKENGVVLPIVIITYELSLVKKGEIKAINKREKVIFSVLTLILVATLFIYSESIADSFVKGYEKRDFTMAQRLLTQPRVLIFYLSLLLVPLPGRLSITHDLVTSTSLFSPITTIFSIIAIAAVFLLSIVRMKKSPYLSFAILWFFITISVESSIIPLEMAFEHRMYLPSIFLIGVFVDFVINKLYSRSKTPVIAVFLVIAAVFSVLTGIRGMAWKNDITLWEPVVELSPNDSRAFYNLGYGYFLAGDKQRAIAEFNNGLSLAPKDPDLLFGLGNIYLSINDVNSAEKNFIRAIKNSKKKADDRIYPKALRSLGTLYLRTGKYYSALDIFTKLSELIPNDKFSHYNIAQTLRILKKYKEAGKAYEIAIDLGFKTKRAYEDMLTCLIEAKDVKEMERIYEKYKDDLDKICIANYVKYSIENEKGDRKKADEYNRLYLECNK